MPNSVDLLSTKIAAPRLRSPLVTRDALLARLDDGLGGKLTLLSAPAGFGKTTLVSAWIAAHKLPSAWVSLDEGDDDPVRFWRYLITACAHITPGTDSLHLLNTPPKPPFEAALTLWINELAGISERLVLILEDYHSISSPHIHETVAFLLDHLPPTLHLVITTRRDPTQMRLPLARLRVRDELTELRAADLRFSAGESADFLRQMIPFDISADAVKRLESHTEGWAAGLRLAALALRGRESAETEAFLKSFDGTHKHVMEYLIGEVFARQPQPIQQFLLETAFLPRLSADLCDAVTGRSDAAAVLDALEGANLFLTTADGEWYRYHALLSEAMQHYARQHLGAECVRELQRRASRWFEAHGQARMAVEAALAAKDYERAATLIEQSVQPMETDNELYALRRLIERLPEAVLHHHPDVCLTYAVAMLFTSDRRAPEVWSPVQRMLDLAERNFRREGRMDKVGQALAFGAMAIWWQDKFDASFEALHEALELLPDDQHQWRAMCLIALSTEHLFAGRLDEALRCTLQGQHLSERVGNPYSKRAALVVAGDILLRQGKLDQARQVFRQVLAEAHDDPSDQHQALVGLAAIAYERNDLDCAEEHATQSLALAEKLADIEMIAFSALRLARVHMARGRLTQAQRMIERMELLSGVEHWVFAAQELHACQTRLALLRGENPPMPPNTVLDHSLSSLFEYRAVLRTKITAERGETALALAQLDERQPREDVRLAIEIALLKALAHAQEGSLPQAKQALVRALILGQPGDHRRLFLDEGAPLAALLQETLYRLSSEPLRDYARRLLADFAREQPDTETVAIAEPLSPQERRVLTLLSSGLTNPEIAQELVVSVNTVKTQVKSIYRKLNVSSRQQAVARQGVGAAAMPMA